MFGASKACIGDQTGCSDYHRRAYLIKYVNESQSIVSLQRHGGVHPFLRRQHVSEGVWELPGPYVDGHELREEGVLER